MKKNYFKTLFTTVLFISCYFAHAQQWNEIGTIDGDNPGAGFGNSEITKDGNHLIVGAPTNNEAGPNTGKVRVYQLIGGNWVQKGQDILGTTENGFFGENIAISDSGNRIVMGEPDFAINGVPGLGKVDVYDFNGTTWETVGNSITGQLFADLFGLSVDITPDGSKIALGSVKNLNGTLMVFELQGDTWTQIGQDINGGDQTFPPFNQLSIAVKINTDGTRVIAGDPVFNDDTGLVQAFELQGDTWVKLGSPIVGDNISNAFGLSLDSNDDLTQIIIGANADINGIDSGQAKVFEFVGNDWVQKGQSLLGEKPGDLFGTFAVINESGDIIAVPALFDDNVNGVNSGSVKVFKLVSNTWIQQGETLIGDAQDDNFGARTAINASGDTIYIGAEGKDINGQENVGQIKIFKNENILSINDEAINAAFKVYPNPSITNFNIDLNTLHKDIKITITDVVGKIVLNNKYENASRINVAHHLTAGLYLVNLTSETTEKQFKLLVK